ncbi:MAG: DNA cytosine methyltransferase [Nostoc sp.]|uniref:DNA cytosine methyltransferase n=1 Tax=Nostoc sp. TaxID=1180 RepID=UPI002FF83B7B
MKREITLRMKSFTITLYRCSRSMTTKKFKALELFAGISGFRLGMANANIQTVWANDINELLSLAI